MNKPFYVYVDVDDTFVRSFSSKRIVIPHVVEHIRKLKTQGATIFCWSSGGSDYARSSAEEFGIADCFEAFLPKPNVLLDDQSVLRWRNVQHVHPNEVGKYELTDYRALVANKEYGT